MSAREDILNLLKARGVAEADAETRSEEILSGREQLPRWYFPLLSGGAAQAKALYKAGSLTVFNSFDANLRDDQILTTVDIIAGAIGVFPFGVRSAFVVTNDTTERAEGVRSDVARVIRNGGSVAMRLIAPVFMTLGPNVRSSASLVAELGVLGDIGKPDSLRASGTVGVESNLALAVAKLTSAELLGSVIVPIRLAYAWSEKDFDSELIQRKGFWFLQTGFGLRVGDDASFRLALLWNRPFSPDVRAQTPKVFVNLGAALPAPRMEQ